MKILLHEFISGAIKATIPNAFSASLKDEKTVTILSRTLSSTHNYEHDQLVVIKHNDPLKAIVNNSEIL